MFFLQDPAISTKADHFDLTNPKIVLVEDGFKNVKGVKKIKQPP